MSHSRTYEEGAVLADEEHGCAAQQQSDADGADRVIHGVAGGMRYPSGDTYSPQSDCLSPAQHVHSLMYQHLTKLFPETLMLQL